MQSRQAALAGMLLAVTALAAPMVVAQTAPARSAPTTGARAPATKAAPASAAAAAKASAAQKAALARQAEAKQAEKQFAQAIQAMRSKQYDAALQLFWDVAQKFPNAPAYVNMAVIYRQKNDPGNAESMLRKALALERNNPAALRNLADLYVVQKRWADAAPLLRRVVASQPKDAILRAVLGDVEYRLGNAKAAETQWRAALRINPSLTPVRRSLVAFYTAKSRPADAKRELKALAAANPKDPAAFFQLGLIAARAKQPKEALTYFRRVVALDPNNTAAIQNVARLEMQTGQTKQATASFQKVLKKNPKDPEAHFALGVAAFGQKRWPAAEKEFRAVLASGQGARLVGARINLATALLNQEKFKEAASEYEKALQQDPKNKQIYASLAFAYQRAGDAEKSTDTYKRLLEVDPNNVQALQTVALSAQFANRSDEAAGYFERILKAKPGDEFATQMLATAYAAQKQTEKAVALYRPLLEKDKRRHADIARLYQQAGDNDKGIAELKTWTVEEPKNAQAWLALGDAYRDASKPDEAIAAYASAKTADPDSTAPYIRIAQADRRAGKLDEALKELAAIPATAKDRATAYQTAGSILEEQKKPDEAIAQYRLAAEADPKQSLYPASVARILLSSGKTDEAVAAYQAIANKDPKDAAAQTGLARALEKKGDKVAAINAWRKVGEINTWDTSWAINIARLQDGMGLTREAVQTMVTAYAKYPGDSTINAEMIRLADKNKQIDLAITAINKQAEKTPDNATLFTQLVSAYTRKDAAENPPTGTQDPDAPRPASGLEVLKNYANRFPKNPGILRALASYAWARGHWEEDAEANRLLIALDPTDAAAQRQLAEALMKTKDLRGAEEAYRGILKADPNAADAHLQLARIYELRQMTLAARQEYEAVLRTEPTNSDATSALARLQAPVGAVSTSPKATTAPAETAPPAGVAPVVPSP